MSWEAEVCVVMCAGVQQSPGQMRVLHIAQSPQGTRPAGTPQMPQQQRIVNLSAYGRLGGELNSSNPQIVPCSASWPCMPKSNARMAGVEPSASSMP